MPYPNPTTGLGVSARVAVDSKAVTLSLSGTTTHQINPSVTDVSGAVHTGVVLTLSAAATASGGTTTYTGTITGGAANALLGIEVEIAGFTNAGNNGTFIVTASTSTTLTVDNAGGVAETHAGTATVEGTLPFGFVSRNPNVATVNSTGLITAVGKGWALVEAAYPTFDNAIGNNPGDGLPINKVEAGIGVTVTA